MTKTKNPTKLNTWSSGDALKFQPPGDKPGRRGKYVKLVTLDPNPELNICEVKLDGDPFTVCVYEKQLSHQSPQQETEGEGSMTTTATKPNAKELRRKARELQIEDWESLTLGDLRKAVAAAETEAPTKTRKTAAKRSTRKAEPEPVEDDEVEDDTDDDEDEEDEVVTAPKTRRGAAAAKKAPAKKAAAKKAAPAKKAPAKAAAEETAPNENGNPYAPGTNMYEVTELLLQGGKRSALVKKLKRKITLKPRNQGDDWDEDYEYDRRLLIVGQALRKEHGFVVNRDGRGPDATISVEAP